MVAQSASHEPPPLALQKLPTHLAITSYSDGRWASERGLSRQAGHRAGTENIRRVIATFADDETPFLTLFANSQGQRRFGGRLRAAPGSMDAR